MSTKLNTANMKRASGEFSRKRAGQWPPYLSLPLSKLAPLTLMQETKHFPVPRAQTEDSCVRLARREAWMLLAHCREEYGASAFPRSLLSHWQLFSVEDEGCLAAATHSLPQVSCLYPSAGMSELLPDGERKLGKQR